MNVKQNKIDDLNTVISITINQSDYKDKVEETLNTYRKKVDMPGFRKGQTPMSIIKKKYEGGVVYEEVNKLVSEQLNKFIEENKLGILGQPLPKEDDVLDLESEEMTFNYEIGLAPDFKVDLSKASATSYTVKPSAKEIEEAVERMRNQLGEVISSDKVVEGGHFKAKITEETKGVDKEVTLLSDDLKEVKHFLGKKVGDVVKVKAQDLYNDSHALQHFLELSHDDAHDFNGELSITVEEIFAKNKAELTQEFFDKIYGEGKVNSEKELKIKIEDELITFYQKETNTTFMNESVDWLLENVKFDLPKEFLAKYLRAMAKDGMTEEQSKEEFTKNEKSLRYQLIESKILSDNKIEVNFEELSEFIKKQMKSQFAMYGYADIPEEELSKYAMSALQDEEQMKRASSELLQEKLFEVLKGKVSKKEKTVSVEEFDEIRKKEMKASK